MNSFRILLFFLILATVFSGGRRRTRGPEKNGGVQSDEKKVKDEMKTQEVQLFGPVDETEALTVKFCEHHDGTGKCCTLPEGVYEGDSSVGLQTQDYDGNACPGNNALSFVQVYGHCKVTLDTLDQVRDIEVDVQHKRPPHERHTIRITQSGIYRGEKHFPDEQVSSVLIECNSPEAESASEIVPVTKALLDKGEDRRHLFEVCYEWNDWWFGGFDAGMVWCGNPFNDWYCCPFEGGNRRVGSEWWCCPEGMECGTGKCGRSCMQTYEACCENVDQRGRWMTDPPHPFYHKTGMLDIQEEWIDGMALVMATYFHPIDSYKAQLREPWGNNMVCGLKYKCNTGYNNPVIHDALVHYDFLNMESQKEQYVSWWPQALQRNSMIDMLYNYYHTKDCKNIRGTTQPSSAWEFSHQPIRDFLIQCDDKDGNTRTIFNLHIPVCLDQKFWLM